MPKNNTQQWQKRKAEIQTNPTTYPPQHQWVDWLDYFAQNNRKIAYPPRHTTGIRFTSQPTAIRINGGAEIKIESGGWTQAIREILKFYQGDERFITQITKKRYTLKTTNDSINLISQKTQNPPPIIQDYAKVILKSLIKVYGADFMGKLEFKYVIPEMGEEFNIMTDLETYLKENPNQYPPQNEWVNWIEYSRNSKKPYPPSRSDQHQAHNTIKFDTKVISIRIEDKEYEIERKEWKEAFRKIINHYEFSDLNLNDFTTRQYAQYVFSEIEKLPNSPILEFQYHITTPKEQNPMTNNNQPLNQILYGPPGTGKTYSILEKINDILIANNDQLKRKKTENTNGKSYLEGLIEKLKKQNRLEFVTFHPAYGYEEFMEGIRPNLKSESVSYEQHTGAFKKLCENATSNLEKDPEEMIQNYIDSFDEEEEKEFTTKIHNKKFRVKIIGKESITFKPESSKSEEWDKTNRINSDVLKTLKNQKHRWDSYAKPIAESILKNAKIPKETINKILNGEESENNKPYFMIIDEINRGNIPKIFGELITLIEDTKRDGNPESISVTLPYSGESFSVPKNVYIIGTMNTADKSLVALDTALRRRFAFTEMMPKPELLSEHLGGINIKQMLTDINSRIDERSHKIGHAFFINCKDENDVKNALTQKIIPLLQEYTYDDWGKIAKILGVGIDKDEIGNFEGIAEKILGKGESENNDSNNEKESTE